MTSHARLSWGILGCGRIARTFAQSLSTSRTGRLAAVASRSRAVADEVAKQFGANRAYDSYEKLLEDPAVEAVYIATPHTLHAVWAIRAARAGKHILCEKPIALNYAEAMAVAEAARQHGVFLMEAFMYRAHPQIAKAVEIVRSGQLGDLHLIRASFAFAFPYNAESRIHRQDLGGGAILDVGCYCMSFARLMAGAALGRPYAEPTEIKALGKLGPESRVDEQAVAILSFENGILAQLSTGTNAVQDNTATLYGSKASLCILSPWFAAAEGQPARLELTDGSKTEVIKVTADSPLYSIEIDAVAAHLKEKEAPCMPVEDTLGNMFALDKWRQQIGLIYDSEKESAPQPSFSPLRAASAPGFPHLYAAVPGLSQPVSRLVLGTMMEGATIRAPFCFALFDYFYEHGGNCFDTAHIYYDGESERMLGRWMEERNLRDKVVVLAKGAHTPDCNPEGARRQLTESLERLRIDYADIYMLHRDNPEIPVGEFVEALNEEVQAGRIRVFGGSNWTMERLAEANAYAQAKGLQGFGVVSNQFSLARMVDPIWSGCVSCSDPESRQWLNRTRLPLFAWSSQARGFFARGSRSFQGDPELARSWYSEDNFERLDRVQELARRKKSHPVHIAAAYVFHQPFPVFSLIGPQKLSELAGSFQALHLTLSPAELAWLNLETESA